MAKLPRLFAKSYHITILHVGRGHLRPAVSIDRHWHGRDGGAHMHATPTKTSVQRLLRTLRKGGGECTPGYPVSSWSITYLWSLRKGVYESPSTRQPAI